MYQGLAQLYGGACMMVVSKQDNQQVTFLGTGFLCHKNGYILTCAHNINLTDKLAIIPPPPIDDFNPFTQETVHPIDVMVVQFNPNHDLALLKIQNQIALEVPPNIFGNENTAQVGSSVGYLGFPFGQNGLHTLKVSQSIISSKVISPNGTKQYQLDAMVHEGNSGGPLVDIKSGQIIGIISGRFSPTGNTGAVTIGNHALGTESSISYATSINYGIELIRSEGINV